MAINKATLDKVRSDMDAIAPIIESIAADAGGPAGEVVSLTLKALVAGLDTLDNEVDGGSK